LTKDPDKRLSVCEALEHAWFKNNISLKLIEIRKYKNKTDKFAFDIFTTSADKN
jgi:hypothetical protein